MVTGSVLADRYRLEERLATGGMGVVFRAVDEKLDRPVAVKILKTELAHDERFVERFRREARAAGALSHPNVAAIYDLGRDDGGYFIAMELCHGRDLARLIREDGPLSPERAVHIGSQLARALGHAHSAGLVHRDVKPANVIVDDHDRVKVTDFGIARAAGQSTLTVTGSVMGTPEYLSPEQAEGRPVGPPSDVYSFGIVLYEMLTGAVPFTGSSPLNVALRQVTDEIPRVAELAPHTPQRLEEVISRATAKDPHDRYLTGSELAQSLEQALKAESGGAVAEAPSVWPIPGNRYDPESVGKRVLITAAVVTLIAVVAFAVRLQDRQSAASARREARSATELSASAALPAAEAVVVPSDIIGASAEEAVEQLELAGLDVEFHEMPSDEIESGLVADSDPAPGTSVYPGDTITLMVSTGPEEDDAEDEGDDGGSTGKSDS